MIEQLERQKIRAVEQVVPARERTKRIADGRRAQPEYTLSFQRKQKREYKKRQEFDRCYVGMMSGMRDVKRAEGKHETADQTAAATSVRALPTTPPTAIPTAAPPPSVTAPPVLATPADPAAPLRGAAVVAGVLAVLALLAALIVRHRLRRDQYVTLP